MKIFSERIKSERKYKKVSQKQIANMLEISQAAYSKMENNKSEPNLNSLKILCIYFDVSADYLKGLED